MLSAANSSRQGPGVQFRFSPQTPQGRTAAVDYGEANREGRLSQAGNWWSARRASNGRSMGDILVRDLVASGCSLWFTA